MDLLEAVRVTYAVIGQEISDVGLRAVVAELESLPPQDVAEALIRCRHELRRISLADILDRLPSEHPGVEEAWAMVAPLLGNEEISIVWTDQMSEAYGVAARLTEDPVAARMAFKEHYARLMQQARVNRLPVHWSASLGWDKSQREAAILDALVKQRITADYAKRLLPSHADSDPGITALIDNLASKLPTVRP